MYETSYLVACESYSLPNQMAGYIDVVKPTLQATGRIAPKIPFAGDIVSQVDEGLSQVSGGAESLEDCTLAVTPACLRALYGIDYVPKQTQNNSFGIGMCSLQLSHHLPLSHCDLLLVEYGTENFLQSDLDAFFKVQSPNQAETTPNTVFLVDGGKSTYMRI